MGAKALVISQHYSSPKPISLELRQLGRRMWHTLWNEEVPLAKPASAPSRSSSMICAAATSGLPSALSSSRVGSLFQRLPRRAVSTADMISSGSNEIGLDCTYSAEVRPRCPRSVLRHWPTLISIPAAWRSLWRRYFTGQGKLNRTSWKTKKLNKAD